MLRKEVVCPLQKILPLPSNHYDQVDIEDVLEKYFTSSNTTVFSLGGHANDLPVLPGLEIKGIGTIGLPINTLKALKIMHLSQPSPDLPKSTPANVTATPGAGPRGGTEQFCWEINPEWITLKNSIWNSTLHGLVSKITKTLYPKECQVSLRLSNGLMYGPGSLSPHPSLRCNVPLHSPPIFAKLVIQLPSECKGGNFIVSHRGKSNTFDFGESNGMGAYLPHYVAYFPDADIQLTELAHGYKILLVYDILWLSALPCPSIALIDHSIHFLADLFKIWRNQSQSGIVTILTEYDYLKSDAQTSGITCLKGRDMQIALNIQQANELLPIEDQIRLFIVFATKTINKKIFHGGEWTKDTEKEYYNDWFDETGKPFEVGKGFSCSIESAIYSNSDSWGRKVETIHMDRFNKTQYFDKCILALFPASKESDIICHNASSSTHIDYLLNMIKGVSDSPQDKQRLLPLVSTHFMKILSEFNKFHAEKDQTNKLFQICRFLNDHNMLIRVFTFMEDIRNEETRNIVFESMKIFEWSLICPGIRYLLFEVPQDFLNQSLNFCLKLFRVERQSYETVIQFLFQTVYNLQENSTVVSLENLRLITELVFMMENERLLQQAMSFFYEQERKNESLFYVIHHTITRSLSTLDNPYLIELIEMHMKHLRDITKTPPHFSWSMQRVAFNESPKLESFLRGTKQKKTFKISDAEYKRIRKGLERCSVVVTRSEGSDTTIIEKTRAYYENQLKKHNENRLELKVWEALFQVDESIQKVNEEDREHLIRDLFGSETESESEKEEKEREQMMKEIVYTLKPLQINSNQHLRKSTPENTLKRKRED